PTTSSDPTPPPTPPFFPLLSHAHHRPNRGGRLPAGLRLPAPLRRPTRHPNRCRPSGSVSGHPEIRRTYHAEREPAGPDSGLHSEFRQTRMILAWQYGAPLPRPESEPWPTTTRTPRPPPRPLPVTRPRARTTVSTAASPRSTRAPTTPGPTTRTSPRPATRTAPRPARAPWPSRSSR